MRGFVFYERPLLFRLPVLCLTSSKCWNKKHLLPLATSVLVSSRVSALHSAQFPRVSTLSSSGVSRRSSWELPDLRDGKIQAISDSDGVNYPWYGNTTETCTIVGPTKKDTKFTVSMNDNFYPSVTWGVPVSDSNVPMLSSIWRDQSFTTWLVAINQASGEILVLQTVRWRMRLHIEVDPNKPLGQRAKLREPIAQEQPQVLGKNEAIPPNAMVKPNANDAQVLMWRPKAGEPVVVIPPKH